MIYSRHLFRHIRFIIGQNIQRLREQRRMELGELAGQAEIQADYLNDYEQGKNTIELYDMVRIACVLDVEVRQLME